MSVGTCALCGETRLLSGSSRRRKAIGAVILAVLVFMAGYAGFLLGMGQVQTARYSPKFCFVYNDELNAWERLRQDREVQIRKGCMVLRLELQEAAGQP